MATISFTVPDNKVAEVLAAIGHSQQLRDENGDLRPATGPEAKAYIRGFVHDAVIKYRTSLQPDIDRSDPTEN